MRNNISLSPERRSDPPSRISTCSQKEKEPLSMGNVPSNLKTPLKKQKNLLELIKTDPQAKLWECILTSILSINDFCEKGLKTPSLAPTPPLNELLKDQAAFQSLCKERQHLVMEQILYNNSDFVSNSVVRIKSHSNPLRRLDSRDQKHKFFVEASLKKENKIDLSLNFKVKEYSYELFSFLRKNDGIDISDIRDSFNIAQNFAIAPAIANTSEFFGKSGATFFFTKDNRFVLKSISHGHFKSFLSNFEKYFKYLLNPEKETDSLMVRIYGLYKISVAGYEKVYFLMMENLTELLDGHLIMRVYDLKGSRFQRSQECFKIDITEQTKILNSIFGEGLNQNLMAINDLFLIDQIMIVRGKDNDFLESDDLYIEMKKEDKIRFFNMLQNDVKFFEACNLMDYSLIFMKALKNPFIEKKSEKEKENSQNNQENQELNENSENSGVNNEEIKESHIKQEVKKRRFRNYTSPDGRFLYSMAIVDYLQSYDLLKLMETQIKSFFKEKTEEISCVDAISYAKRFSRFIISVIQSDI